MNCHNCGGESSPAANFCRHCGVLREDAPASGAGTSGEGEVSPEPEKGADPSAQLETLRVAVLNLQAEVARYSRRIAVLESALSLPGPAPTATPATAVAQPASPSPAPPATTPATAADQPASPSSARAVPPDYYPANPANPAALTTAGPAGGRGGQPPRDLFARVAGMDWEWLLGGNWLARLGVVILIIGIGFFLKLAFDNDWIGETGRVVLGLVVGLALLGGGEYWRRKYPVWALSLTGGGIAILYLSIFAAFALYDLVPPLPALGFCFLVTLTAAGLALRYESRTIAILGILGGFATPLLLADRVPEQVILLAYVVVLDLGVLGLASFRNWRWFTLLGLVGSLIVFGFWWAQLEPGWQLAQLGITIIFLIFVGATTLFHLIWRRVPGPLDLGLMSLNAAAYFSISYGLLSDEIRDWMGGFTLLLALFYGLLAYGILLRHRGPVQLSLAAAAIALVLLTIAAPVQFNGPWVSVAWAVQAVALVWLSFNLGMPQLRWFGVGVLALLTARLLIHDFLWLDFQDSFGPGVSGDESYWPIVNWRFLAFGAGIGAMYLSAYPLWRWRDRYLHPAEGYILPALLAAANFLSLFILSLEVIDSVEREFFVVAPGDTRNVISLSLSLLWAVYAAVLIILGIVRRSRWVRLAGLGLLALPIVKLFVFDVFALEREYRVAAFIGLGLILLVSGFLYQRYHRVIRGFLLDD